MTTQFAPIWDDAAVAFTTIKANATDTASAATSTLLDLQVNSASKFVVDKFGELILTPTARTSGSDSLLSLIAPADTTRAAGTEATDINFNLARTVQFAAGNITDQRAIRIQAPTYSFASASTITNASTLSISGPPVAGTNATITSSRALHVESGNSFFNGEVQVNSILRFGGFSAFQGSGNGFLITYQDQQRAYYAHPTIALSNGFSPGYVWASNVTNSATYYGLYSGTNNVIQFRGGTGSQVVQFFNTFTDASNYERLALQFGTYSSARYAQIAAESAGTGTADINFVLTPKGTGAFILGPPPDGTAVGGNARGNGAVDLQTKRTAATQVASAPNCIIAGTSNTCSGPYGGSAVFGDSCVSTSSNNLVAGGGCSVTGYAAIALGAYSVCSANEGAAAIGRQVNVSGTYGFGANLQTEVPGVAGAAFGDNSRARLYGEFAHASGRFSTNGDCQRTAIILRGKTTTNTPVELVDPTRFIIPSGFIFHGILKISGSKSDGTSIAIYMRKVAIKRVGNTTTLLQVETIGTDYEDNVNTNVTITADDVNEALKIEATGITGETWRWQSVIEGGLYAYGT